MDSVPRALRILRLVVAGSVVVVVGSVVLALERFVLRPLLGRPRANPAPRGVPGPGAAGEPDDEPMDVLTPAACTVPLEEPWPPGIRSP